MAILELESFSAYYRQKDKSYLVALNDLNLVVDDGDFVVVMGPSGSGKTTLLRAIIGFVEEVYGVIKVNGMRIENNEVRNRNFGYISQSFDLYKTKTIFENIAFPLRMNKIDSTQIKQRVYKIAKELNITSILTRKPYQISIGQQQQVAIARALIKHPQVLLFDEPFSNLDEVKREEMRKLVHHIHNKYNITTIFVTHSKDDAIKLADKIAILKYGTIVYYNTKNDLLTEPNNKQFREYLYGK